MARKYNKEIKTKYFTPPSTFENLWMEFHQSVGHIKNLLLGFIMALSNILKALSTILSILCDIIELLIHFVLTVANEIWLGLKIVLVMGEAIKALGPEEPMKKHTPSYSNIRSTSPHYRNTGTALTDASRKDSLQSDPLKKYLTIHPGSTRKDSQQPDNSRKDSFTGKDSFQSDLSRKDFTTQPVYCSKNCNQPGFIRKDSFQSDHIRKDSLQSDLDNKESSVKKKRNSVQFDLGKNTVHLDSSSDNVVGMDVIKRNSATFIQEKKFIRNNSDDPNSVKSLSAEHHKSWTKSWHYRHHS
ncbi:uncharacterized protein LOC130291336 [Hyla sarda]|uniref:uncharacterized protein LOC130291336 n=1 Tax=Hyla sarda TaxID=327740 RepID=UPI0024C38020|nr:uncharacterized protein LOC130291336 [Hyla sarda]XP_056395977.1 uncharacterized protein LOC130291336 [Hyla sarda]XP_056395978.1 uncharacterized protein LOC130291336 [Hyla sarda]XP_056395979.1 uncharacterized protein LOC130291336 [Hyla sarda]